MMTRGSLLSMPLRTALVLLTAGLFLLSLLGLVRPAAASHAGGDPTTPHTLAEGTATVDGVLDAGYEQVAVLTRDGLPLTDPNHEVVANVYMLYDAAGCGGAGELFVYVEMLDERNIADPARIHFWADLNGNGIRDEGESLEPAEREYSDAERSAVELSFCYSCAPGGQMVGLRLEYVEPGSTESLVARLAGQTDSPLIGLTIGCPAPAATPTPTPTQTVAPTATPTQTAAPTATPTATAAPTATPTGAPTATAAPTATPGGAVQPGRGTPAQTVAASRQAPDTASSTSAGNLGLLISGVLLLGSVGSLATASLMSERRRRG